MFHHARISRLALKFPLLKHLHTRTIPTATPLQQWHSTKNLIHICGSTQSLNQTKQAHATCILRGILPSSVFISAALILRYATFQASSLTVYSLFHQTLPHSKSSTYFYNILIRAHSILSLYNEGLVIYNEMVRNNVKGDHHTYPFVLKVCSECYGVEKGLEIHCAVIKVGFDKDVFVNNTLMLFYGNCIDLESVEKVFGEMPQRDVVSWNMLIRVLSDNGCCLEVIDLFKEMVSQAGCKPNAVSVVSVLPVCASLGDGIMATKIHCYALKVGLDSQVNVGNAFIDAYGKCVAVEAAKQVFDEMVERNCFSWNAIITSFAYIRCNRDAFDTFRSMIDEGIRLNSVTISSVLPLLVELGFYNKGREIHGFTVRMGMDVDISVANSLIDMYGKSGHPIQASNVFYNTDMRNVVSWNIMVANYAQNGLELEAIEFVRQMQFHGQVPNVVTFTNVLPACARICSLRFGKEIHARLIHTGSATDLFVSNALIDMYAKCGCLNQARNVFLLSPRDVVSYNTLICGYSQTNEYMNSLNLFSEMGLLGIKHNAVSFIGVLSACANISTIKQGNEIHASAIRRSFDEHLLVANSLLDMYTKSGRMDLARKVFDRISNKNSASYTTMILGFGMLGQFDAAINLFEAMREDGVECDSVSYIAVLSVCSHGGLVEEGRRYFGDMLALGIKPSQTHYACMVDLLGRSGLTEEALDLMKSLPMKPNANIWGPYLGLVNYMEIWSWVIGQLSIFFSWSLITQGIIYFFLTCMQKPVNGEKQIGFEK